MSSMISADRRVGLPAGMVQNTSMPSDWQSPATGVKTERGEESPGFSRGGVYNGTHGADATTGDAGAVWAGGWRAPVPNAVCHTGFRCGGRSDIRNPHWPPLLALPPPHNMRRAFWANRQFGILTVSGDTVLVRNYPGKDRSSDSPFRRVMTNRVPRFTMATSGGEVAYGKCVSVTCSNGAAASRAVR